MDVSPEDFEDSTLHYLGLTTPPTALEQSVTVFKDLYRKVGGVPAPMKAPPSLSEEEVSRQRSSRATGLRSHPLISALAHGVLLREDFHNDGMNRPRSAVVCT